MDSSIRSLSGLAIVKWTKAFEIVEIGVEERVHLGSGIKDSSFSFQSSVIRGNLFHHSMLCKRMTLLADPIWVICE